MKYLKAVLLLAWAVPTWIVYQLINVPLMLLGLLIVPVAIAFLRERVSPITGKPIVDAPAWLWPWGNSEDGYDPLWYWIARPRWSRFRRMYTWAAIRNSVNNLRWVPILNPKLNPARICAVGGMHWSLAWQGPYVSLELFFEAFSAVCGWRVYARDMGRPAVAGDWRVHGTGFRLTLDISSSTSGG